MKPVNNWPRYFGGPPDEGQDVFLKEFKELSSILLPSDGKTMHLSAQNHDGAASPSANLMSQHGGKCMKMSDQT